MMYSVVDIAGINRISERILDQRRRRPSPAWPRAEVAEWPRTNPWSAATMFGVTTPCVDGRGNDSKPLGYEVLVFHATGAGGQSMEALIARRVYHGRPRH